MHLIDSHCHIDFSDFDHDRDQVLAHCLDLGVKSIVVPGVTETSWPRLIDICAQSAMLLPALGLHPMFMADHHADAVQALAQFIEDVHPIAIGEIGLDFYLPEHDKQAQTSLFIEQLKLAQKYDLPVLLHVRKAHDQVINVLKRFPVKGGIVHAFSGSKQQADHYQKLGFLFGVGGAITYPRATRLQSLMSELPLSSLVLETDAPDMPLAGQQGQRNTPENIPTTLDALVKIRSESKQQIADTTTHNCQRLFGLAV